MRHARLAGLAVGLLAALSGTGPAGAGEAPGRLSFQARRVVIFKDGHALVVKEGRGRTGPEGSLVTDQGPTQAVLGTFWVTSLEPQPEAQVTSMTVERLGRTERRGRLADCRSVLEVVKANLGKSAVVSRREGPDLEGKLHRVLEAASPTPPATSPVAAWSARPAPAAEPEAWRPLEGELFVLRTPQGDVLLSAADVRTVRVADMALRVEREEVRELPANRLRLRFQEGRAGVERGVRLIYFRPGLRWVPAYRIGLGESGRAEIALQAEVLNEAEDLEGAPVDFVVGMPTFRFKDAASPLALERVLRRALEEVAPDLSQRFVAQQAFGNVYQGGPRRLLSDPEPGEPAAFDLAEKAMGAGEVQDLFYYQTASLSLKTGERAAVALFRAEVPVRHLYTWEPRLPRGYASPRARGGSPLIAERNEVWHQIALENRTPVPWTTGPAMVLDQGRPVGQDMLTFTPPGGEVLLPVTAAVSVRGTVEEAEEGRERKAERWQGSSFTRLTNRASLRVTNAQKTPIRLILKASVGGRAVRASDRGSIQVRGHDPGDGVEGLNPHSDVSWELALKPGEERRVQLTYLLFVSE
jgi:hypothetical protein